MSETNTTSGTLNGAPLTTNVTEQLSPSLLRSAIDDRIVRIRPASTPLDQISRMCGARHCGSMKVDYYTVDCKPGSVKLSTGVTPQSVTAGSVITLKIDKAGVLSPSETVMIPAVTIGTAKSPLICYVKSVNGKTVELVSSEDVQLPALSPGTGIVRMGRAAGELDVQTPQFSALPKKDYNYCQIFKAQIEESIYQRLSDKEVGWSFTDQEEVAVVDMRLGMEKSFLFGNRTRLIVDESDGKEVYLTGGIWRQAAKEWEYDGSITQDGVIELMKKAFTGGAGSRRKVLMAGSDLIESLNKLDAGRVLLSTDKETVWGVDFNRIVSKFGTLYVIHSEVFDLCGRPECGMIIDPEYITKYSHVPFQADRISFRKQGVRNTEAVVLTESSCLVLRYPDAHMRVVRKV